MNPKTNQQKGKIYIIFLVLILIISFLLLTHKLTEKDLEYDDAVFVNNAEKDINNIINIEKNLPILPAYTLLLHYWIKAFGKTELNIRLLSVIFGLASVLAAYCTCKQAFSRKISLISCLVLALSSFIINFSTDIDFYSLYLFLSITSIYFFIRFIKKENNKHIVFFILFTVLMLYTSFLGFVLFAAEILFMLVYKYKDNKTIIKFLAAILVILILTIPVQLNVHKAIQIKNTPEKPFMSMDEAKINNEIMKGSLIDKISKNRIYLIYVILFVYSIFAISKIKKIKSEQKAIYFLIACLGILCTVGYFIIKFKPEHYIFLFPISVFIAIDLITKIIPSNVKKPSYVIIIVVYLMISANSLYEYYSFPENTKLESTGMFVNNNLADKDLVIAGEYETLVFNTFKIINPKTGMKNMNRLTKEEIFKHTKNTERVWLIYEKPYIICNICPIIDPSETINHIEDLFPYEPDQIGSTHLHRGDLVVRQLNKKPIPS